MKLPVKKIIHYGCLVLLGLVVIFLVVRILLNLDILWLGLKSTVTALRAIVLGIIMAYLLYPLSRFTEKFFLRHQNCFNEGVRHYVGV